MKELMAFVFPALWHSGLRRKLSAVSYQRRIAPEARSKGSETGCWGSETARPSLCSARGAFITAQKNARQGIPDSSSFNNLSERFLETFQLLKQNHPRGGPHTARTSLHQLNQLGKAA